METIARPEELSYQAAYRAHSGSSFVPDERAKQEQAAYVEHVQGVYESLLEDCKTDVQRALLLEEIKTYKTGYLSKLTAVLSASSRCISSMITGPANFPTRRNEKALRTEHRRYEELREWDHRAKAAVLKKIKALQIEEAGGPIEAMRRKIEGAERLQATMKQANAIIRKKGLTDDERVASLVSECSLPEGVSRELLKPDFAGRIGFADSQLINNNANIKRMRDRLSELERRSTKETTETETNGVTITENADLDRLQLAFPGKPEPQIIALLKQNGFHWSPSNGVWQRQLTEAAKQAAQRIIKEV